MEKKKINLLDSLNFEKIKKLAKDIWGYFQNLDQSKKLLYILGGGGLFLAILLASFYFKGNKVYLFSNLQSNDFSQVTRQLESLGYFYEGEGQSNIKVREEERDLILAKLAQEKNIPQGIPGWKLFDMSSWTETNKEIDVKYMRALRGEIKKHIESLKNIEEASIDIAMAKESLYSEKEQPYTAAVTVHLAPGYQNLSSKEIQGITYLISRAVGSKLRPENITITDSYGKIISDENFVDATGKYSSLTQRARIEERARASLLHDIRKGLEKIYSSDRIQIVRLNMDFNWEKIEEEQELYTPVELEKDDPQTPYSERKIKDSLVVAEDLMLEKSKDFSKEEKVIKHAVNKIKKRINKDSYQVAKVSVAIAIDGQQELSRLSNGEYDLSPKSKVIMTPLSSEDLVKAENIVKKAINFNKRRGDQIAIENIMFDRTKYWASFRDRFRQQQQKKRIFLIAFPLALFSILLLFIFLKGKFFSSSNQERKQKRNFYNSQKDWSLRDKKGLSLEEKASFKLHENAQELAKHNPSEVAYLLRSWLTEK